MDAHTLKEGKVLMMRGPHLDFERWVWAYREEGQQLRPLLYDAVSHQKSREAATLIQFMPLDALNKVDKNGRTMVQWVIRYQEAYLLQLLEKRGVRWHPYALDKLPSNPSYELFEVIKTHMKHHPSDQIRLIDSCSFYALLHHPLVEILVHVDHSYRTLMTTEVMKACLNAPANMYARRPQHPVDVFEWCLKQGMEPQLIPDGMKLLKKHPELTPVYEAHRLNQLVKEPSSSQMAQKNSKPKRL